MTKSVDYIIVGNGFASFFFAHQLVKNKKSFILFSSSDKGASQVSAGVINPVVLKKFTTFWKAKEQIDFLQKTLAEIESYIGTNFGIDSPIHRVFHDENERNLWLKKSQNSELNEFLDDDFKSLSIINNPHQTGQVKHSSRLDVYGFFNGLTNYFEKNDSRFKNDGRSNEPLYDGRNCGARSLGKSRKTGCRKPENFYFESRRSVLYTGSVWWKQRKRIRIV